MDALREPIRNWVEDHERYLRETVQWLVQLESQNLAPEGNERKAQLAVAEMLRTLDCEVDVFEPTEVEGLTEHPMYWPKRPCEGRPNVVGIRPGSGAGRSLLFSGHMDTVPVGPEPWNHDPWAGTVEDQKLFGLGAYDMKGGIAVYLLALKALEDLGIHLQGDLLVETVVDEEFGGANGTLASRLRHNADAAILPEPTNMVICPAHHGGLMLRVTFHGKGGWGFSPETPRSPVDALGRFIDFVNDWAAEWQDENEIPPEYENNPDLPVIVNQVKAGDVNLNFFGDRVPDRAWLTVWVECFPGTDQEEIIGSLRRAYERWQSEDPILEAFDPEFEPLRFLQGSGIGLDHPIVQEVESVGRELLDDAPVVQGAPLACDGHMFNLHSPTPMILFGPGGGNPHATDEFLNLEDAKKLLEIFIHTSVRWCGLESYS